MYKVFTFSQNKGALNFERSILMSNQEKNNQYEQKIKEQKQENKDNKNLQDKKQEKNDKQNEQY